MVSEGTVGASATPDRGVARALVRAVRPRQWVKNLLVVAAPLAAGELGDRDVLAATLLAFVGFCLAASAVYLVNDTADRRGRPAAPDQAAAADRGRRAAGPRRAGRRRRAGGVGSRGRAGWPTRSSACSWRLPRPAGAVRPLAQARAGARHLDRGGAGS